MTVITETPTVTELTHTEERVQYAVGDCCAGLIPACAGPPLPGQGGCSALCAFPFG